MKLALGTVQFGLDYGISNKAGQVSHEEVGRIIKLATENGVTMLDSATSYGNSETVLGNFTHKYRLACISKLPSNISIQKIEDATLSSLKKLNIRSLYGLFFHHAESLLGDNSAEYFYALKSLKAKGLCQKIGCSVYSPEEALNIVDKYELDIFQIPANIFDQRLLQNSVLDKLKDKNIEVHVRSIFLQGVVFISPDKLPHYLNGLLKYSQKLHAMCGSSKEMLIAHALAPFVQNPLIDKIVVGCCSAEELAQILKAYNIAQSLSFDISSLSVKAQTLINPSQWPL